MREALHQEVAITLPFGTPYRANCDQLCSIDTLVMKPCHIRNISNTRVGHTYSVHFLEFATYPRVVPVS